MKRAILLSGGIDSIALTYQEKPDLAYTIDYGQQPAIAEIQASKQVCKALNIPHIIITANCSSIGSGTLADKAAINGAPCPEWWPFRNQLLVTLAASRALSDNVKELILASVLTDGEHLDGSKKFYDLLSSLLSYQEGGVSVCAPAVNITSVNLVRKSGVPKSILAWAHSCHTGNFACGDCRGCYKHQTIMNELGYGYY